MPKLSSPLPTTPDAWWRSAAGQTLLQREAALIPASLRGRPGAPWLWLGPEPAADGGGELGSGRGLRLCRDGELLRGALACGLPLPLPSEVFGTVVIQHVLDQPGLEGLLRECARVLAPGGKLWLFALNPWSPYRTRWRKAGLRARDPWEWQARLRRAGLDLAGGEVRYLGPVWRAEAGGERRPPAVLAGLRSICLLEATSRVVGLIPPAPIALRWNTGAASA